MEDIFLVLCLILIIWIIFVADLINDHGLNRDMDEADLSAKDVQEHFHVHGRYGHGRYRGYGRYGYGGYAYGLPYGYNYVDDYDPWWSYGWYSSPWSWASWY
jgi:hypothetical protein